MLHFHGTEIRANDQVQNPLGLSPHSNERAKPHAAAISSYCRASGCMSALKLYRDLLRAARSFPVRPVGRKIEYNCRELFDLYRKETRVEELNSLHGDAEAALRLIAWMRALPQVGCRPVSETDCAAGCVTLCSWQHR